MLLLVHTFVLRGCKVDENASSRSDKTFVSFSTLVSGSRVSFLLGLLSLNLSDEFDRK